MHQLRQKNKSIFCRLWRPVVSGRCQWSVGTPQWSLQQPKRKRGVAPAFLVAGDEGYLSPSTSKRRSV